MWGLSLFQASYSAGVNFGTHQQWLAIQKQESREAVRMLESLVDNLASSQNELSTK